MYLSGLSNVLTTTPLPSPLPGLPTVRSSTVFLYAGLIFKAGSLLERVSEQLRRDATVRPPSKARAVADKLQTLVIVCDLFTTIGLLVGKSNRHLYTAQMTLQVLNIGLSIYAFDADSRNSPEDAKTIAMRGLSLFRVFVEKRMLFAQSGGTPKLHSYLWLSSSFYEWLFKVFLFSMPAKQ